MDPALHYPSRGRSCRGSQETTHDKRQRQLQVLGQFLFTLPSVLCGDMAPCHQLEDVPNEDLYRLYGNTSNDVVEDSQHFLLECTDASLVPKMIWWPVNLVVQQLERQHWTLTLEAAGIMDIEVDIEVNICRCKQGVFLFFLTNGDLVFRKSGGRNPLRSEGF